MSKPDISIEDVKVALLRLEALVCPNCGLPILIPLPPGVGLKLAGEQNITDWCQNYCGYFVLRGAALVLECEVCHQPVLIETPIYLVHQSCPHGCGSWVWHQGGLWEWSVDRVRHMSAVQRVEMMRARQAFLVEMRQQGNIPFDRC